jgi:hypothetical protein
LEQAFPKVLRYSRANLVRPHGGIFFRRPGDLAGRKYSFAITIVTLGASTVAMGISAQLFRHRHCVISAHDAPAGTAARTGSRGVATSAVAINRALK